MYADVFCLFLVVAASAANSDARARNFRPIEFEGDGDDDANEQRFHLAADDPQAGSSSCCGPSSAAYAGAPSTTSAYDPRSPREIPLSVIKKLNQVSNVSELFTKFMPDVDMYEAQKRVATTGFQGRSALNLERKAAIIPKAAGCAVELKTISLRDTNDPSLYYYPPCTRVYRCGGCCAHDLLACQPTKTETLNYEVMVSRYNDAGKLEFVGRKSVLVYQDSKCKCDCVIKEDHCNSLQTYVPGECRCACNNEDDREKCNDEPKKVWDPMNCVCQCRETMDCTSGFAFDPNTCSCEASRVKTKITGYDFNRNTYSLGGQ